jgi:hypothetical protein
MFLADVAQRRKVLQLFQRALNSARRSTSPTSSACSLALVVKIKG